MRILLWLLLIYVGYRIVKSFMISEKNREKPVIPGTETFKDPVCGVYVTAEDAFIGRNADERIYFCSRDCLEKYRNNITEKVNS